MNKQSLTNLFDNLTGEAKGLLTTKNADYGADTDAFHNFRMASLLQLDPALGVMLRMLDKQARLLNFIKKGRLELTTESWRDCCVDLINYTVILCGLLIEKTETDKTKQLPEVELAANKIADMYVKKMKDGKKRGRPRK